MHSASPIFHVSQRCTRRQHLYLPDPGTGIQAPRLGVPFALEQELRGPSSWRPHRHRLRRLVPSATLHLGRLLQLVAEIVRQAHQMSVRPFRPSPTCRHAEPMQKRAGSLMLDRIGSLARTSSVNRASETAVRYDSLSTPALFACWTSSVCWQLQEPG